MTKQENFIKELEDLSKKYGVIIKSVGGVEVDANLTDFQGYNPDIDSGDLLPIFN